LTLARALDERPAGQRTRPDLRVAHEAVAIAAIALHAVAPLGDSYLHPGIADLAIPFASNHKQPYMALGIIAGWGFILLGLSFYLRQRIGIKRWKVMHRFTALAWVFGVIHTLGEGSDAGRAWFLVIAAIAVIPTLVLLVARLRRHSGRGVQVERASRASPA